MKKYLLLTLFLLSLGDTAELKASPSLLPVAGAKVNPNRLQRTMRRLHRQAQSRARKNRSW